MNKRRRPGPIPMPKQDRRNIAGIVMLSPKEKKALARIHGRTPFSTWAREILLRELTEDPLPVVDRASKATTRKGAK